MWSSCIILSLLALYITYLYISSLDPKRNRNKMNLENDGLNFAVFHANDSAITVWRHFDDGIWVRFYIIQNTDGAVNLKIVTDIASTFHLYSSWTDQINDNNL